MLGLDDSLFWGWLLWRLRERLEFTDKGLSLSYHPNYLPSWRQSCSSQLEFQQLCTPKFKNWHLKSRKSFKHWCNVPFPTSMELFLHGSWWGIFPTSAHYRKWKQCVTWVEGGGAVSTPPTVWQLRLQALLYLVKNCFICHVLSIVTASCSRHYFLW